MGSLIHLDEFDSKISAFASQGASQGLKRLAYGQGIYFLIMGLWPILDIQSFLWITGPKSDLWLVRTLGLLIAAVGFALVRAARENQLIHAICIFGSLTAFALAVSDLFYVALGSISRIYLWDAGIQIGLVLMWRWLWPVAEERGPHTVPEGPGYY
jgi:hypothetical protein